MSLKSILYGIAITDILVKEQIEAEIQKAINKYWDACKYPRKTKKRMRKEALKDYNFYSKIKQYIL